MKDGLKNEDNLKNKDALKNEDDLNKHKLVHTSCEVEYP